MSTATDGRAPALGLFLRLLDNITLLANVVGSCLIVGLVLLITADVFGRNLFTAPVSGVPEMVSLSIVAIVFLQVPQALRAGRLTRSDGLIDIIQQRLPGLAKGMETVFDLVGFTVVGVILYSHWPIMNRAWERGDFIGAVGNFTAPTWPVKLMLTIGATLLALQFLARILRRFIK